MGTKGELSSSSSAIFSSPLPNKKIHFNEKHIQHNLKGDNLYPNCDASVWMRSCENEIMEPIQGEVRGKLPEWLNGALLRNGPGSVKSGDDYFNHLFDSYALLHRFNIKDGKVTYQCRFVQTEIYKKNKAANRIVTTAFGTKATPDPCQSIFQQVAAIFKKDTMDNSLISLYPFGDEVYAFNETPLIHKINPQNLKTERKLDVSEYVAIVHHTSHPHVMADGTVFNLGMTVKATGPHHNIVRFPPKEGEKNMFERAEFIASVPSRWPLHPSYMHSFGITDNYFIIIEQPLNLSVPAMVASKIIKQPLASCFRWYPNEMTQINIVDKKTGCLAYKFFSQAFFYLHVINQYEVEDYIVLDICIYRDPSMLNCMYINAMKTMQQNPDYAKMFRSRPARFVLPLNPEKGCSENLVKLENTTAEALFLPNGEIVIIPEKLCEIGCETPRINYDSHLGKQYRYFYAISADVDAKNPGTIIKVDTVEKTAKTWCEENCYPSEPIFVSSPDSQDEDDGVVLAAMVWGGKDTNHVGVIILDAKTFTELGRAEFRTPGPVPKCLHGWFLRDK